MDSSKRVQIWIYNMKEFEILVLKHLLAKLELECARQQFGNDYVFGFDDVIRIIHTQIDKLSKD